MSQFKTRYTDGTYMSATHDDWHEVDAAWKAGYIAQMMKKVPPPFGTICDVGCGVGGVLFNLQKMLPPSIHFKGVDVSQQAIGRANQRANEHLIYENTDILEGKSNVFDIILLIDVFEHVDDYLGFLSTIRSRAGYFVFHIPLDLSALSVMREWPIMRKRKDIGHIHYFTKATALATLEDCGYEIVDHFYTPSGRQPPDTSLKATVKNIPGQIFFKLKPDATVRLMGGHSLMVLAKGNASADTGESVKHVSGAHT